MASSDLIDLSVNGRLLTEEVTLHQNLTGAAPSPRRISESNVGIE